MQIGSRGVLSFFLVGKGAGGGGGRWDSETRLYQADVQLHFATVFHISDSRVSIPILHCIRSTTRFPVNDTLQGVGIFTFQNLSKFNPLLLLTHVHDKMDAIS